MFFNKIRPLPEWMTKDERLGIEIWISLREIKSSMKKCFSWLEEIICVSTSHRLRISSSRGNPNPIPYQIEKDQIMKLCKEQMFRSWQREPRITKRMLQPATRGISIENHICNFLINRWQHASLNDIRAEKDELLTNKGESNCYLGWRKFIEDT